MYKFILVVLVLSQNIFAQRKEDISRPNIVFIFADDMGIGDISHTTGMVPTPNIDRLVNEGMSFTDAHTSSSVCTPSRYSLLTGRYNWRTRLKSGVFGKPTEKPLIKEQEKTVATLLQQAGYTTACIGKWHLGIGWEEIENYQYKDWQKGSGWNIDYTKKVITPTTNGFDYFYGITASLDIPPYVYIENDHATQIPSVTKGAVKKGTKTGRLGAAAKDFELKNCLGDFAKKSIEYIHERAEKEEPFFLYLPLTSPHTPILPSSNWKGKSKIGDYGDYLMETDWVVGEVVKALDTHGFKNNTLVVFSSDNGCSPAAQIPVLQRKGHSPNGNLRGYKADIYEGGHRVPFIARWPEIITAGTKTDRLTCLTDFMATCSEITGVELDDASGVDGVSFLPTFKDSGKTERAAIVHHSIDGSFAIRKGDWKLILCAGSGGWSYPKPKDVTEEMLKGQLFNLSKDISETNNLYNNCPKKVKELTELLQSYVDKGRSTSGEPQQNDREVSIYVKDRKSKFSH